MGSNSHASLPICDRGTMKDISLRVRLSLTNVSPSCFALSFPFSRVDLDSVDAEACMPVVRMFQIVSSAEAAKEELAEIRTVVSEETDAKGGRWGDV